MTAYRSPHDNTDKRSLLSKKRALQGAIALSFVAFLVQGVGSIYTGSLALLGDTAHLFTDLFSLVLSLVALILACRPTTSVQSFGLYRLEVLSTFLNGVLLFAAGIGLGWESVDRIFHPSPILTVPLIIVAAIGLALNLISAYFLSRAMKGEELAHQHLGHSHGPGDHHHHGHDHSHGEEHKPHHDRNLQSALMHVLADALGSVAVVIGAIVAYYTGWLWVDPALAVFLSLMILRWAWNLIYDSGHVLLESTPKHLDSEKIGRELHEMDARVVVVEDLHVWEITSRMYAATAEVRVGSMSLEEAEGLRQKMHGLLKDKHGIAHAVLALRP